MRRLQSYILFSALVSLAGCTSYVVEHKKVYMDPSFRRVVLFNDTTNLILQDTGIFNESVNPGQRVQTNVNCYGRFNGLLDAYRIIGKDEGGNDVLEWYGQRKYRIYTDGKNQSIRGISVDAYVIFSDRSFYPSDRREYWLEGDPCSPGSSVKFKFGRD